jgi:hypothetical protein
MHCTTLPLRLTLGMAALCSWSHALDAPAGTPLHACDDLSQAAVQRAFQLLSENYIRREDLTFEHLNRVALEGLLQRLDFGAELLPKPAKVQAPALPLVAEIISPGTGYLRPHSLEAKVIQKLRQQLSQWSQQAALNYMILDLRVKLPDCDFQSALALLECFTPRDELAFKLQRLSKEQNNKAELFVTQQDPVWTKQLLILIDQDCNNAAETVAAVMQLRRRCILLGTPTRGNTVRHEIMPLDDKWSLRFASAEMLLANDRSVFRRGVKPDLLLALDQNTKRHQFEHNSLAELLRETPRPRFNERSLVEGTHPELTDFLRRSRGEQLPTDAQHPQDCVLQRAVDLCICTQHLETKQLDWQSHAEDNQKEIKKAEPH